MIRSFVKNLNEIFAFIYLIYIVFTDKNKIINIVYPILMCIF